jgi:hypothetical protein
MFDLGPPRVFALFFALIFLIFVSLSADFLFFSSCWLCMILIQNKWPYKLTRCTHLAEGNEEGAVRALYPEDPRTPLQQHLHRGIT